MPDPRLDRLNELTEELKALRAEFHPVFMAHHKAWTTQFLHCVEREGKSQQLAKAWADQATFMLRDQLEALKADIAALQEERDGIRFGLDHEGKVGGC